MKDAKETSNVAIDRRIHRELKEYSRKTGIKISFIAEEAISEWLNNPEQIKRAQRKQ